ncbi:MAG: AMP-binding protein, partial [Mailhella sp.]|nr:AMP-binding protein [Mailhella sp.]
RIGAVLVAVNTNYRDSELEYLIRQSECEFFFCIDGFLDYDYVAALNRVIPELASAGDGELRSAKFPKLRRVLSMNRGEAAVPHPGIMPIAAVLGLAGETTDEEYAARRAMVKASDVVNMQYTSGTTGFPKGVMLTHSNIGVNGWVCGEQLKLTEKDRLVVPLPLFHCMGCVMGVLGCATHGTALIITESFSPERVMAAIQEERCTGMFGVPSTYVSMVGHRRYSTYDFSSMRFILMGGASCPEALLRKLSDSMGLESIIGAYGQTETSPLITMPSVDDPEEKRFRTSGRVIAGIDMEIRDPSTNRAVPAGEQGEICCRGWHVMAGYYRMPEATAETVDPDGWLHTGDIGWVDEEGYLTISGRIKDMIVRGGENIYPREVEEFISYMDSVAEVHIVGIPSSRYGEDVAAFVVPVEGAQPKPEDIRDFCRGRIAWHKIPRYVAIVESVPKTANGKVRKVELKAMAVELFPHVK